MDKIKIKIKRQDLIKKSIIKNISHKFIIYKICNILLFGKIVLANYENEFHC